MIDRLDAARLLSENQDPTKQFAIKQAKRLLEDAGVRDPGHKRVELPESTMPSIEVLDLEAEWQRQSQRFVELGFHAELGIEKQDYLNSLPKFEPQPEEYKGKFDLLLLVETRIPWERQAELAGITISDYLRSQLSETHPVNKASKTPESAYTGYFNKWGQRFIEKIAPVNARKNLNRDEVGGGPCEGIALQVAHPNLTKEGKYFDLIGYRVESGPVPFLSRWDAGPRLSADWGVNAGDGFRPLVRGSKIVTL